MQDGEAENDFSSTSLLERCPSRTDHDSCPGCLLERRKAVSPDTLPYRDLLVVALICLCNSLPTTSLFPYVYYLIQDIGIAESATQIGKYAGFLGTFLLLGRFMSATIWGIIADRFGHKPVTFIGNFSTSIFLLVFGFSTNYWIALSSRFLIGFTNGLTGTIRGYATDICGDAHQASALAIAGNMWSIGLLIGPAIGGYLSQPAEKLPILFPSGSLFDKFPYALPSVFISLVATITFVMCFWLPESLHIHRKSERDGLHINESNLDEGCHITENNKDRISKVSGSQKSLLKNRPFIAAIVVNALWSVHSMAYTEIFSLWASSPRLYHGLAFSTAEVADVLAVSGLVMFLFQAFMYPPMVKAYGAIKCLRACMFLSVPVTAVYPLVAQLDGVILWVVLMVLAAVKNMLSVASLTGTFILINNSVLKAQRGTANGVSTSIMSGFQAIGPACAGIIFSWSEEREDTWFLPGLWMVFSILTAVAFVSLLATLEVFLPSSLEKPPMEEFSLSPSTYTHTQVELFLLRNQKQTEGE